jgi:hypothetical protein
MSAIRELLEHLLPDAKVLDDLRTILRENGDSPVDLGNRSVTIPIDTRLEIVTKACYDERTDTGFGDFRVAFAIGGISEIKNGIPHAHICFAIVYYNTLGQIISADFLECLLGVQPAFAAANKALNPTGNKPAS